jgi:signal transduction histidine kinase
MQVIVFVDDEPSVLDGLRRMVRTSGLECRTEVFSSANEALQRIAQGGVDVIVTDLRMPEMDGIELVNQLKSDPATENTPVLVLTGSDDSQIKETALSMGVMDFVNKPANPQELLSRLRNALRIKSYQNRILMQNIAYERQLAQAQRTEMAGLLASGVAHDLNNILQSISGHVELASHKVGGNDAAKPHLQKSVDAIVHAKKLVQRIRDLGKPVDAKTKGADFRVMVDDALELLGALLPNTVKTLWNRPDVPIFVPVDTTRVFQVIMNLCINASDAMHGQGTITISITEDTGDRLSLPQGHSSLQRHFCRLRITDDGEGMDEQTLSQVFEPYFTTKPPGRGTGLGLPTVRRILLDVGGDILIQSEPGVGTKVDALFPSGRGIDADYNTSRPSESVVQATDH